MFLEPADVSLQPSTSTHTIFLITKNKHYSNTNDEDFWFSKHKGTAQILFFIRQKMFDDEALCLINIKCIFQE